MKKKKVYVNLDDTALVEVIFIHKDYMANAGGAKDARFDGLWERSVKFIVYPDKVEILNPSMAVYGGVAQP